MKYSINFALDRCRSDASKANVRMIVQWSRGGRTSVAVGYQVVLAYWSREAQRCKSNTKHAPYSASRINREIQRFEDAANDVFQAFERIPTNAEGRHALLVRLGLEKAPASEGRSIDADFIHFTLEQFKLKGWSSNTLDGFRSCARVLKEINPELTYADIATTEKLDEIILKLQERGLRASTIRRYVDQIKWFLRWAERKGFVDSTPKYTLPIKQVRKAVVFLTPEELLSLYRFPIESLTERRIRDFFCFCCFTGLRHSDAYRLKTTHIHDGVISIVSRKDADNLHIELNDFSSKILEDVELSQKERAQGLVLPHIRLAEFNTYLKRIAKRCGIDAPVQLTFFAGGKRVETVKPKWQLLSSHVGRKTFICTALSHNISPNIIMKWTGHSTYNAMRPYIDIVDKAKKNAMEAFNKLSTE